MGTKRSKKKRDAARRAAEQPADENDGGYSGTAQGKQEAAWGGEPSIGRTMMKPW